MKRREEHTLLEDEGTGYIISVSDLMSGLVFIFIITLMAFVLTFNSEQIRQKKITDKLTNNQQVRADMLEQIQDELKELGILVEVNTEHGILHLTEHAINFPTGQADLPEAEADKLMQVGVVLSRILPCYAANSSLGNDCATEYSGKLESVFIEGHTDNMPYVGRKYNDNWDLSAQRAMYTYREMIVKRNSVLAQLINTDDVPIFSISGYGEGRPRNRYVMPTRDAANRRIDFRFIMTPPRDDIAPVAGLLREGI